MFAVVFLAAALLALLVVEIYLERHYRQPVVSGRPPVGHMTPFGRRRTR